MNAAKTRATISDVAAEAGVHSSTVSRVLNGHAGTTVRAATRERVLVAADRLAYRPSAIARSLRLQQTLTLGMVRFSITASSAFAVWGQAHHRDQTRPALQVLKL